MSNFWLFALVDLVPVAIVIATNPLKGVSRLVAPDTLVMVMLYAIFGIRPLFADRFSPSTLRASGGFYGLVPSHEGQMTASYVGLILLWSIAIGAMWYTHLRKRRSRQNPDENAAGSLELDHTASRHLRPGRAVLVTICALAIYSAILIMFMGLSGFLAMSGGRSAEAWTGSTPEIVMIFPLAGSVASATLIMSARPGRIDFKSWLAIGFCTAATLGAVSQLGQRRLIVPAILIVTIALLMRRPVRLRLSHIVVGVSGLMVLAILPNVRGGRRGEGLFESIVRFIGDDGPMNAFASFFTSYDTEMYDYIAMLAPSVANGRLELGLGSGTVLEFLAHPLPATLTPFLERSTELKIYLFNYYCFSYGSCGQPNPVISVGGTLFFDWGHVGVLLGGVLVGAAVRALSWRWSRAASLTTSQCVITAVCASYPMVAARTDTVFAIWWCLYTLIIAVLVIAAMGEGEMMSKLRGPRADKPQRLSTGEIRGRGGALSSRASG